MAYYNLSNISETNSTLEILRAVNLDIGQGWFTIMLLIALFVIILINWTYYSAKEALLASSFFASFIAWMMWLAALVPILVPIIASVILLIAAILSVLAR